MLASVLNSELAIKASLYVVRAFVRLRAMLTAHKDLDKKLDELERRVESHDEHIQSLFEAIRRLMAPDPSKPRRIGFRTQTSPQFQSPLPTRVWSGPASRFPSPLSSAGVAPKPFAGGAESGAREERKSVQRESAGLRRRNALSTSGLLGDRLLCLG